MNCKSCGTIHNFKILRLGYVNEEHPSRENLFMHEFTDGDVKPSPYLIKIMQKIILVKEILEVHPNGSLILEVNHKLHLNYLHILPLLICEDEMIRVKLDSQSDGLIRGEISPQHNRYLWDKIQVKCINGKLTIESNFTNFDYELGWELSVHEFRYLKSYIKGNFKSYHIDDYGDGMLVDINGKKFGLGTPSSMLCIGTLGEMVSLLESGISKPLIILGNVDKSIPHLSIDQVGVQLLQKLDNDSYFRSRFLKLLMMAKPGGGNKLYPTMQRLFTEKYQRKSDDGLDGSVQRLLERQYYEDLEQSEVYYEVKGYLEEIFELPFFQSDHFDSSLNNKLQIKKTVAIGNWDKFSAFQQYAFFIYLWLEYLPKGFVIATDLPILFQKLENKQLLTKIMDRNKTRSLYIASIDTDPHLWDKFDVISFPSDHDQLTRKFKIPKPVSSIRVIIKNDRYLTAIPNVRDLKNIMLKTKDLEESKTMTRMNQLETLVETIKFDFELLTEEEIELLSKQSQYGSKTVSGLLTHGKLTSRGRFMLKSMNEWMKTPYLTLKQIKQFMFNKNQIPIKQLWTYLDSIQSNDTYFTSLKEELMGFACISYINNESTHSHSITSSEFETMIFELENHLISNLPIPKLPENDMTQELSYIQPEKRRRFKKRRNSKSDISVPTPKIKK